QGRVLVPLIALAVMIGACVEVLLTPAHIARWLGDGAGLRGVLAGWIAGALTPGGGPIGLPLAGALARQGAALPAILTYLTSMSLLSLVRLPMEWGLLGGRVTLIRWGATFFLPLLVGVSALAWQRWAG
ncbi:MAG: permease, partial [Byssovorax sp.]